MATPRERHDEREREHALNIGQAHSPSTKADPGDHAQQQGDGQPENARELEDPSSGSAPARTIREE